MFFGAEKVTHVALATSATEFSHAPMTGGMVEHGRLVREFLRDEQESSQDVNVGRLPEEAGERFETWIDGARWVEEDELKLDRPEQGWLWIHRAASKV